jgi:hypothetical protein
MKDGEQNGVGRNAYKECNPHLLPVYKQGLSKHTAFAQQTDFDSDKCECTPKTSHVLTNFTRSGTMLIKKTLDLQLCLEAKGI